MFAEEFKNKKRCRSIRGTRHKTQFVAGIFTKNTKVSLQLCFDFSIQVKILNSKIQT